MSTISKLITFGSAIPPQPPASFVSYSDSGFIRTGGTSSGSFSVNAPSGIQENDFLIMVCLTPRAQTFPSAVSWSSSGFTSFETNYVQGAGKIQYFYKQATASEPSTYTVNWTFNGGFTPRHSAFILCFRDMSYGAHTSNYASGVLTGSVTYMDVSAFSASGDGVTIGLSLIHI